MSAAKHGDPTLNFRTHTVEGRKLALELSSDFHTCAMVQKHTQINNEIINSKKKLIPLSPRYVISLETGAGPSPQTYI